MAERLEMPQETVRKCLRYLDQNGYIKRVSGIGRTRSRYAVRVSFRLPILDPLTPAPEQAGPQQPAARPDAGAAPPDDRPAGAPPRESRSGSGAAPAGMQPKLPAVAGEQAGPVGNPPPAARPPAPVDTRGWCPAAIVAGRRHQGRRCCGTTPRQVAERQRRVDAAAARERDRQYREGLGLGMAGFGVGNPADTVADMRAAIRNAQENNKSEKGRNRNVPIPREPPRAPTS